MEGNTTPKELTSLQENTLVIIQPTKLYTSVDIGKADFIDPGKLIVGLSEVSVTNEGSLKNVISSSVVDLLITPNRSGPVITTFLSVPGSRSVVQLAKSNGWRW